MKKTYNVDVDCANCAAKMETEIGKLEGVESVSISFMTEKMVLKAQEEQMEGITAQAQAIIKKIEPDVVMRTKS